MFFVQNDQAEVRARRENGRSGPEKDGCIAPLNREPGVAALALGKAGMEDRKFGIKASPEA